MSQADIDRIIARLLDYKPNATDGALSRATGFTEAQVRLARYRASKPVPKPARHAQAACQPLAQCSMCDGPMEYKGMCRKHYQQQYRRHNGAS